MPKNAGKKLLRRSLIKDPFSRKLSDRDLKALLDKRREIRRMARSKGYNPQKMREYMALLTEVQERNSLPPSWAVSKFAEMNRILRLVVGKNPPKKIKRVS